MSKTTPIRQGESSNEYRRRLRSYQTPVTLRRSPRFLPQNDDDKHPISSSSQTHLQSPPITPYAAQSAPIKKTQQRCSTKCRREPLQPIENNPHGSCRRSARLASDFSNEKSVELRQEKRRSLRLIHPAKVSQGKENVGTDGMNEEKGSSDSSKPTPNKETQQRCSTKCQKEHEICRNSRGKPLGTLRRSPRLASDREGSVVPKQESRKSLPLIDSANILKKKEEVGSDEMNEDKGNTGLGLSGVKQRPHRVRFVDSTKVSGKENVRIDGRDGKMGEGGTEKGRKRKRAGDCEEKVESKKADAEEPCGFGGWTKEQEVALQRAYLAAKPSPHFWKKVSKMVPGKSAQECFDKVNGSLETPPQLRPRSRANRSNLSPISNFSLSGSKSNQPAISLYKKMSSRKKSLVAQKTVRHLLRKHCVNDQSHEADYFSVLETSPTTLAMDLPEIISPLSPDCISSQPASLENCSGGPSSAHRKLISRFKPLNNESFGSPEVLKRIKNVALHEKYIDQLHNRERRRKFVGTSSVALTCKNKGNVNTGVLKVARTALISEAKEVISQYQHMQFKSQGNTDIDDSGDDDDDDCIGHDDDDDDE